MLKETGIADTMIFVILQNDPTRFEESFVDVNINLSKINFENETHYKMLTN